jgi:hypothetical protein
MWGNRGWGHGNRPSWNWRGRRENPNPQQDATRGRPQWQPSQEGQSAPQQKDWQAKRQAMMRAIIGRSTS